MEIKIAGAGAGKTTQLAQSIIDKQKVLPKYKNIYCITFTNNAVACITKKLHNYYGEIPVNIKLSTIHSFLYREIINPYYYLLYSKHFKHISTMRLSDNQKFRNIQIKELMERDFLHISKITEIAKWVIYQKSSDNKQVKKTRELLLVNFSKYCGQIFIDEAQDMDQHMKEIVNILSNNSISLELIGDPKQDLKGFNVLRELCSCDRNLTYITNCYRCPQKHLILSNSIITEVEEWQTSVSRSEGTLNIVYETDVNIKKILSNNEFDLKYISKKNDRILTKDIQVENQFMTIFDELASVFNEKNTEIQVHDIYYLTQLVTEEYKKTNKIHLAVRPIGFRLPEKSYARIAQTLDQINKNSDEKIVVPSIESIKGQEGKNCLFILTTDLAPYLFLEKKSDNKSKNKLYVALTRSLDKLTILISTEVERKYTKEKISDFFIDYI